MPNGGGLLTLDRDIPVADNTGLKASGIDFEVGSTGLAVPKSYTGIAKPNSAKEVVTHILLPETAEQITSLTAEKTSIKEESKFAHSQIAFLHNPAATLAREVKSMSEKIQNPEVKELARRFCTYVDFFDLIEDHSKLFSLQDNLLTSGWEGKNSPEYKEINLNKQKVLLKMRDFDIGSRYRGDLVDGDINGASDMFLSNLFGIGIGFGFDAPEKTAEPLNSDTNNIEITDKSVQEFARLGARFLLDRGVRGTKEAIKASDVFLGFVSAADFSIKVRNEKMVSEPLAHEMDLPQAAEYCLQTLYEENPSDLARRQIYNILAISRISQRDSESLLRYMSSKSDLSHPLAFKLAMELSVSPDKSEFIEDQEKKRAELVEALSGLSAQECFDRFYSLRGRAQNLVWSGSFYSIPDGKVGLEIEYNTTVAKGRGALDRDSHYYWSVPGYEIGDNYGGGYEIRNSLNSLTRDGIRLVRDIGLATYLARGSFRDIGHYPHLSSLHVHLDDQVHPYEATLGEYYVDKTGHDLSRYNSSYSRPEGTKEIRGLVVPRTSDGKLNLGRLEDIINLLALSSKQEPSQIGAIETSEYGDWRRLVFGYVSSVYHDPQTRLACLKALEDPMALRGGDIAALFGVYSPDVVKGAIKSDVFPHGKYRSDRLLEILDIYEPNSDPESLSRLYSDVIWPATIGTPRYNPELTLKFGSIEIIAQVDVAFLESSAEVAKKYIPRLLAAMTKDQSEIPECFIDYIKSQQHPETLGLSADTVLAQYVHYLPESRPNYADERAETLMTIIERFKESPKEFKFEAEDLLRLLFNRRGDTDWPITRLLQYFVTNNIYLTPGAVSRMLGYGMYSREQELAMDYLYKSQQYNLDHEIGDPQITEKNYIRMNELDEGSYSNYVIYKKP